MTPKLPKIEKCVCGKKPTISCMVIFETVRVGCCWSCWWGPSKKTQVAAILAWNAVMRAAKTAKKARAK